MLALVVVTGAPLAWAAPRTPQEVILRVPDDGQDVQSIVMAMRGNLADLPVTLTVEVAEVPDTVWQKAEICETSGETVEAALVAIWLTPRYTLLMCTADATSRPAERELEALEGVGRAEAAAVIVRAAVIAALDKQGPGPRPEPPAGPSTSSHRWVGFHASYALDSQTASRPLVHGLRLGVDLQLTQVLSLFARYTFDGAQLAQGELATIRVVRRPLWIGATAAWPVGKVRLGPALALVIDGVTAETVAVSAGVEPLEISPEPVIRIVPAAQLRIPVAPWLSVDLAALAAIPVVGRRYVVQGAEGPEVVLDCWRVQPGLQVGLTVSLF